VEEEMGGRKVLVVEDNESNMLLTTVLLKVAGFEPLEAKTAEEGIEAARAFLPDLVLMDVGLPDMNGLDAAKILKADPLTKHIPIVALTAYAMRGDEEKTRAAGCDGYIAKPIEIKTFAQKLEKYLALSH
jgi:two-component system cell cycle response regulator DivK